MLTKQKFTVIIFLLLETLCYFHSNGQTVESIKLLEQKISNADSILIISHKATIEYGGRIVPDVDPNNKVELAKWYKRHPPKPKYLIKGKLNRQIIKESYKLSKQDRINMTNILSRPIILDTLMLSKCDQPAHSIVIYQGSKTSYIDICFGCQKIHTSKDINLDESNVDEKKWAELKAFFKAKGLTKLFKGLDQ